MPFHNRPSSALAGLDAASLNPLDNVRLSPSDVSAEPNWLRYLSCTVQTPNGTSRNAKQFCDFADWQEGGSRRIWFNAILVIHTTAQHAKRPPRCVKIDANLGGRIAVQFVGLPPQSLNLSAYTQFTFRGQVGYRRIRGSFKKTGDASKLVCCISTSPGNRRSPP